MEIKHDIIIKFILGISIIIPAGYMFSLYYSNLYVGGDQIYYIKFYDALVGAKITDIPFLQLAYTGSAEPFFGLLTWVGAHLLPKNEWFSIFNALLFLIMFAALEKRQVTRYFYPLIFTNYYLFVIAFSAERLKFSIIILMLAYLVPVRWKYPVAALSVLFHFQSILFSVGIFGAKASGIFRGRNILISVLAFFASAVFFGFIWWIFGTEIRAKLDDYSGNGLEELIKFPVFFVMGMILAQDKVEAFFIYLLLAVATLLLGDDRINMITFIFTIFYSFSWKRGLNPISLVLLSYFSWRGLIFLSDIAEFGTGYPEDFLFV